MSRGEHPATFYAVRGGNDVFWRVESPAKAIGAKALILDEDDATAAVYSPKEEGPFQWRIDRESEDLGVSYPLHEGTAVWTRPDPPRAVHIIAMRELGITTVTEVDDNYLANPRLNIFTRINFGPGSQREHAIAMTSAERIVFSTDLLRDIYWRDLRSFYDCKVLPEPFVCRNCIDERDWPTPIERSGPLRVTWMGSPSHVWDVDLAWAALMHARNLGCETWLVGYDPGSADSAPGANERSKRKAAQWRKVGAKVVPWQDPSSYQRGAIPADIGLCPLLRNAQTLGKSDVKFIEYTMAGAATIASNVEVYSRTIVHGETGLLVGGPQEMLDAVDLLQRDERLRLELVANARQYVREERGLKQLREEWGAAVA